MNEKCQEKGLGRGQILEVLEKKLCRKKNLRKESILPQMGEIEC